MDKISFTEADKELLFRIPLLRDLPTNVKYTLIDKLDFTLQHFSQGEQIAVQGKVCNRLYILLHGRLQADFIDGLGNKIIIENIVPPRAFATPHLFGKDNYLPASFTALEEGILFTATRDSAFALISAYPDLLRSFFHVSGCCNKCTTIRLRLLSYKNIRSRFISYLLDNLCPNSAKVELIHNQAELAEYLNVTRPALSKEINQMIREGLILKENKTFCLLNIPRLKSYVL